MPEVGQHDIVPSSHHGLVETERQGISTEAVGHAFPGALPGLGERWEPERAGLRPR